MVLCCYPIQAFPTRNSLVSLHDACRTRRAHWAKIEAAARGDGGASSGLDDHIFVGDARGLLVSTGFIAATTAVALAVTDLGAVVGLVGATGATIISLIAPAAAYLCLCRDSEHPCSVRTLRVVATAMLLLGISIMASKVMW